MVLLVLPLECITAWPGAGTGTGTGTGTAFGLGLYYCCLNYAINNNARNDADSNARMLMGWSCGNASMGKYAGNYA